MKLFKISSVVLFIFAFTFNSSILSAQYGYVRNICQKGTTFSQYAYGPSYNMIVWQIQKDNGQFVTGNDGITTDIPLGSTSNSNNVINITTSSWTPDGHYTLIATGLNSNYQQTFKNYYSINLPPTKPIFASTATPIFTNGGCNLAFCVNKVAGNNYSWYNQFTEVTNTSDNTSSAIVSCHLYPFSVPNTFVIVRATTACGFIETSFGFLPTTGCFQGESPNALISKNNKLREKLYPTLANNEIQIDEFFNLQTIRILDIFGDLKDQTNVGDATESIKFNVSSYSNGTYIAHLVGRDGQITSQKFQVMH